MNRIICKWGNAAKTTILQRDEKLWKQKFKRGQKKKNLGIKYQKYGRSGRKTDLLLIATEAPAFIFTFVHQCQQVQQHQLAVCQTWSQYRLVRLVYICSAHMTQCVHSHQAAVNMLYIWVSSARWCARLSRFIDSCRKRHFIPTLNPTSSR